MKFIVTMKDPDTLLDAIADAVKADLALSGLAEEDQELLEDARKTRIYEQCGKWFRYGEYLAVEIDTDAGTCTVQEAEP